MKLRPIHARSPQESPSPCPGDSALVAAVVMLLVGFFSVTATATDGRTIATPAGQTQSSGADFVSGAEGGSGSEAGAAIGVGRAASAQGGLWMTAALNVRLLDESAQLVLREGEVGEVAAVASLICDVHDSRPRCGSQCTSTRRDRRHVPDYSDFVVEPIVCWDVARVLVATAHDYDVPLDELLATAYQESRFRPVALGSGAECGLFQQTTHHIRYASANVDDMGRVPHGDAIDVCTYLLRPENAAWHFALKYHHEVAQNGRNWAAYYNGGHDMWGYQDRHESYRARFSAYLSDFHDTHGTLFGL